LKEKATRPHLYWRRSNKKRRKVVLKEYIVGKAKRAHLYYRRRFNKRKEKKERLERTFIGDNYQKKRRAKKTNLYNKSTIQYIALFEKKDKRRRNKIHSKMNSYREAMTQMSSTGQPLLTKKRWMVFNKEIVFGNGIIPYTNYSGGGIISIWNHLLTKDIHNMQWQLTAHINKKAEKVGQKLRKVGVHNY